MSAVSVTAMKSANGRGGTLCTSESASVHLNAALAKCAKEVFVKPCRALMAVLNLGERDAKYRLAAKRKFTAAEIAELLRTEEGIHFLVRLMGDAEPKWWQAVKRACLLGTIAERRAADYRLLRKAANAHGNSAEFTSAFRSQDPDFYSVVLAGYDEAAAASPLDGSVAPKRGRR